MADHLQQLLDAAAPVVAGCRAASPGELRAVEIRVGQPLRVRVQIADEAGQVQELLGVPMGDLVEPLARALVAFVARGVAGLEPPDVARVAAALDGDGVLIVALDPVFFSATAHLEVDGRRVALFTATSGAEVAH
jgi:hypothetical protein